MLVLKVSLNTQVFDDGCLVVPDAPLAKASHKAKSDLRGAKIGEACQSVLQVTILLIFRKHKEKGVQRFRKTKAQSTQSQINR